MLKASVKVDMGDFEAVLRNVAADIDDQTESVANAIAAEAKRSAAFADKTKKLRRSIRVVKSKFEFGGHLVVASAPHASLIEFGHRQISKSGAVVGEVAAHPFLRPARDKVFSALATGFGGGFGMTFWSGE